MCKNTGDTCFMRGSFADSGLPYMPMKASGVGAFDKLSHTGERALEYRVEAMHIRRIIRVRIPPMPWTLTHGVWFSCGRYTLANVYQLHTL